MRQRKRSGSNTSQRSGDGEPSSNNTTPLASPAFAVDSAVVERFFNESQQVKKSILKIIF